MGRWLFYVLFIGCLVLGELSSPQIFAADDTAALSNAKSQLLQQKSKIQQLKDWLFQALKIHSKNEHELKSVELKISSLQQRFNSTSQQASQQQQELSELEAKITELTQQQQAQRLAFEKNIRAAHRNSEHSRLQLVLDQEDPEAVNRMLKYYNYITRSQLKSLENYQKTLAELQTLNREKVEKLRQLQSKKVELSSARLQLNESLQERKQVLQESQAKIEKEKGQLREMQKDQQALANLIARLNKQQKERERQRRLAEQQAAQAAAEANKNSGNKKKIIPTPIAAPAQPLRGDLLWPTQGQLAHRFGEARAGGQLKWNGIFINAPSGAPVIAVRGGTVVFADWLRGFGLLLIIDHDNGYMSLYGHNANLRKKVGDTVKTGETIAQVGQTGGNDQSGLYFEIRANGRPVDPLAWMPKR